MILIIFDSIWLSRSELTYTFLSPYPVPSPVFPRFFFDFWDPWPCRMRPRLESPNRQTYVPPGFTQLFAKDPVQGQTGNCNNKKHPSLWGQMFKKKGFQIQPVCLFKKSLRFCFWITWETFENDHKIVQTLGAPESTIQNPDQFHRVIGKHLRSTAPAESAANVGGVWNRASIINILHVFNTRASIICGNFTSCLLYFCTEHLIVTHKILLPRHAIKVLELGTSSASGRWFSIQLGSNLRGGLP